MIIFTKYCIHSNTVGGSLVRKLCDHDRTPRSDLKTPSIGNALQIPALHGERDATGKRVTQ